jgi:hypothetical protein
MRVHSWNPSFTPLQPVGCEIERAITIGSKALAAQIAEQEHVCERNKYFCRSAYCAVGDSGVLQDAQAAKDRRVRITKNVPVLRIDHISIKGMLLGVWSASYSGECDSRH